MNKRGIVLVIAMVVMAVVLVILGAHFSSLLTEKKSADTELLNFKALNLAEAAGNHALTELRERIRADLKQRVSDPAVTAATIEAYIPNQPLEFLRDFAYGVVADGQFNISAGQATLEIATPLDFGATVPGTYSATITLTPTAHPSCGGALSCEDAMEAGVYYFAYNYSIAGRGLVTSVAPALTKSIAFANGSFKLTVRRGNFAKYALFTNHHRTSGNTLVWFTANTNFNGPVHTNEMFSFANNPSAHFTEDVSQVSPEARFYNNGNTRTEDASAYPVGCTEDCTDKPLFDKEFLRGQNAINLPSTMSQTQMRNKATAGTDPSTGIWLPNSGSTLTGGIFINGNQFSYGDNPTIAMSVDGQGRPIYTISRGTLNTKQITVDYANDRTIVADLAGSGGTSPGTYNGIPDGTDGTGIIIYTDDNIGYWDSGNPSNNIPGLSGTVQKDTKVTVASERDLMITNNIVYEKDPRIEGNEGYENILGILSWSGNVRIGTDASDDINIHGVVMASNVAGTSGKGMFNVDNYNVGDTRGTATLLGGVISDYYGAFGTFSGNTPTHGYGRNFVYDNRMLEGRSPPYFPTITNFDSYISDTDDDDIDDLGERIIWLDMGV